jgi:hypothetical protein
VTEATAFVTKELSVEKRDRSCMCEAHRDPEMLQASAQAVLQLIEFDWRPRHEGCLLEEDMVFGEGHRVQERGQRLVPLLHVWVLVQVRVSPVHEEHGVEIKRM